ncbi:MAG: FkbM family methyltransferase [Acetobacteraceae bacterium]|nr:FkbM family methyltransferase [Acetobacteraceae bacterium]
MSVAAVAHSLRLYHAPARRPALDAFHARFLAAGELAFDVGAHVGDRAASFSRLGARVIAIEPQPPLLRALRLLFRRDARVTLRPVLLGEAPGRATLRLNTANPTVATVSDAFIAAADGAPGWEGQSWDAALDCEVTTLDALIAAHGEPSFCKIDVEGHEAAVLAGLSRPLRTLSFEFTTIQRDVAGAALARLVALGYRHFNACLGESMEWAFPAAVAAAEMGAWLGALPAEANSGDVYASLEPERLRA